MTTDLVLPTPLAQMACAGRFLIAIILKSPVGLLPEFSVACCRGLELAVVGVEDRLHVRVAKSHNGALDGSRRDASNSQSCDNS